MPSMVGRLLSYADVQYRQEELAREFAEARGARSRRALRRAARAARAGAAAPAAVTPPPRTVPTPVLPEQPAAHSASPVLDERLPVG